MWIKNQERNDDPLIKFFIFGHKNVLATHKNTIEFTKDTELSRDGDCIVGVSSDFELSDIETILSYDSIRITLLSAGYKDMFEAKVNKDFDDPHEIVFRVGEFKSKRTLGIRASKAARQLDRRLIDTLKEDGAKAEVIIEGIE